MKQFKELNVTPLIKGFVGEKIKMNKVINKQISVSDFRIAKTKFDDKKGNGNCLYLQVTVDDVKRVIFTSAVGLMNSIEQVKKEDFPFLTTIVQDNERFEFT